ncbi:response regulator, partial [Anaerolinea sp.]
MPEKILVVDDDALMRLMVTKTLSTEGFEFLEAENGVQAVEKAIAHQPDLIIMDVNMPEMDGYEACQRIRSNPITSAIPIILVTSLSTVEDKIKGFDSGADDY